MCDLPGVLWAGFQGRSDRFGMCLPSTGSFILLPSAVAKRTLCLCTCLLATTKLLPMDTKECQTKVALPEVDLRAKLGTSPSGSSPALGGAGGSRDVKPGMASFSTSKHSVFISQTNETKRGEEGEKRYLESREPLVWPSLPAGGGSSTAQCSLGALS